MPEHGESRAVLVTGAAGGIGTATIDTLAKRGYRVYAGVRAESPHLEAMPGVQTLPLDVTSPEDIAAAAAEVTTRQHGHGLHAVINNAGVIVHGPLELVPPAELHRQFDVNVHGPAEVTRAFLPMLRQGRGRVINVSAPTARVAVPYNGPIGASKAALESLSDAARVELAPWGIPVVIVIPGSVDTAIFTKADAAARKALVDADPDRVALYQSRLEAVAAAMANLKSSPPQTVADTIVRAVEAARPKARYVANSDARLMMLVSRLPRRLRDRMLTRTLGLHKVASDAL
ncbi:SDR family oxidoreductase [Actinomadura alba]|uniref:SDR family oxidoreductase n=2 Tax=Actinomadura alba TaxID=406431 RepID=A0ABR7LP03_9ACTN|nr:SDR family oxidoreductase [Actinomadura alba]